MKIEFRFNDSTEIILKPETERERTLIRLSSIDCEVKCSIFKWGVDDKMNLSLKVCEFHE